MSRIARLKPIPGPGLLQIIDIPDKANKDDAFWSLDYPLALIPKYGDIINLKTHGQIMVASPSAIETIFKTHAKKYQRNPNFYSKSMKPIFGKSLLTTESTDWKPRRKLALPAYNQTALKHYAETITELTQKQLAIWEKKCPKKLNILTEMGLLSLKIALKIFSNREFTDTPLKKLGYSIQFCIKYTAQALFIHPWKPTIQNMRFFWHMRKIDHFLLDIIRQRRHGPCSEEPQYSEPNLLDILLNTKDEISNNLLTDQEILDEFKSHIIPGHETTACCLSWMWYLLAKNPTYREQMEAELEHVLKNKTPTQDSIQQLPITKAIISEALRLYPPIWCTPRTNIEATEINDYEIPKNSNLVVHLYALHRNPNYWEHPNEFMPERFLEPNSTRHPFAFLPFIAGNHTCIASHLSILEATLITALLAQRMRFELPKKVKVKLQPNISLRPKGGITMYPKIRTKGPTQSS